MDLANAATVFAPSFLDAIAARALVAELAAAGESLGELVAVEVEVDRVDFVQLLLADAAGAVRRLQTRCEPAPPHRIVGFFIGDPLTAWTDRPVEGRDGTIHVRQWVGEGPDLLLLHGGRCDVTTWDYLVPLLSGRCTALDLRGHGRADPAARFSFEGSPTT